MHSLQDLPQDLASRIRAAVKQYPDTATLFQDIANHLHTLTHPVQTNGHLPPSKKRKLQGGSSIGETFDSITDVSFSIPQRKKFKLEISRSSNTGSIRATNPATGEAEFGVPCSDVDTCICLPVPEKAQPQYSFCLLPASGDDHILFTVPGSKIKAETVDSEISVDPEESFKDVTIKMLNKRLKRKVIEPNEKDFASTIAQAHRKGEKAVHVKAFRGSKDGMRVSHRWHQTPSPNLTHPGFLFFLPTGIIFAFKKPILYYPFHTIASISYTSVLQRTFNLNLNVYSSSPPNTTNNDDANETQEIEFSMLDQADFAGIDAYIKRRGLQDASMAEQRRAQKYNINGVKGQADAADQDDGGGEEGELQKAAREAEALDDEDEEDDENFDPGSEGESEGSGSDEEEEEEGGEGNEQDGERDIVEDELGSEAGDVSE
ncbi:MAG: hypothetical protein L6R40_004125 [Gallowayella cf. fulva]|nr:MAG: hypothetical protein L6R40_004125 [Xanthomendoza cf. fulva]